MKERKKKGGKIIKKKSYFRIRMYENEIKWPFHVFSQNTRPINTNADLPN